MATAEQVAATTVLVDRFAATSEQLQQAASDALGLLWRGFDGWYDDLLIGELAEESAGLSLAAQRRMQGLAEQYMASVLNILLEQAVPVASTELPPVRNGTDLIGVYRRPAEQYRHKVATGTVPVEALRQSATRRDGLVASDLRIVERDAQQAQMAANQVTGYRRVIRPELSRTGTCGLCIAASDQVYTVGTLMPLHPACHCKTMPIVADDDPGREINAEDLERLYREAGSTKAEDLRRTRYEVHEHGELGPLLTKHGDRFKGPAQTKPLEEDPERAARMLAHALPVLESLESRSAAGDNVSDPLGYQRRLVAKLRRIVGDN